MTKQKEKRIRFCSGVYGSYRVGSASGRDRTSLVPFGVPTHTLSGPGSEEAAGKTPPEGMNSSSAVRVLGPDKGWWSPTSIKPLGAGSRVRPGRRRRDRFLASGFKSASSSDSMSTSISQLEVHATSGKASIVLVARCCCPVSTSPADPHVAHIRIFPGPLEPMSLRHAVDSLSARYAGQGTRAVPQ